MHLQQNSNHWLSEFSVTRNLNFYLRRLSSRVKSLSVTPHTFQYRFSHFAVEKEEEHFWRPSKNVISLLAEILDPLSLTMFILTTLICRIVWSQRKRYLTLSEENSSLSWRPCLESTLSSKRDHACNSSRLRFLALNANIRLEGSIQYLQYLPRGHFSLEFRTTIIKASETS